jgi:hypothetical protein
MWVRLVQHGAVYLGSVFKKSAKVSRRLCDLSYQSNVCYVGDDCDLSYQSNVCYVGDDCDLSYQSNVCYVGDDCDEREQNVNSTEVTLRLFVRTFKYVIQWSLQLKMM